MVSLTNNVLTTVSLPYKLKRTSGNPNRHRWPVTLISAAAIQDVPCVVNTVGEKCNYLSRISPEIPLLSHGFSNLIVDFFLSFFSTSSTFSWLEILCAASFAETNSHYFTSKKKYVELRTLQIFTVFNCVHFPL